MSKQDQLSFEKLKPQLIRFGFAFYGKGSKESPDPERLILNICSLFPEEMKVFKMLLCWLNEFGYLINVERLKHLLDPLNKETNLHQHAALAVICSRQVERGDKRFQILMNSLFESFKNLKSELTQIFKEQIDPYLIEKYSVDPYFEPLGIRMYKMEAADRKKLFSPPYVYAQNLWLKLRVLAGSNYRADVLYLKSLDRYKTKYELWKALGSSQQTAYRLCKELEVLEPLEKLELKEAVSCA